MEPCILRTFTPKGKSDEQIKAESQVIHNNYFEYQTNQKLQSLDIDLKKLSSQCLHLMHKFDSDKKLLEIEHEKLDTAVRKNLQEMSKMLDSFDMKVKHHVDHAEKCLNKIPENFVSTEQVEKYLKNISELIAQLSAQVQKDQGSNNSNFMKIRDLCNTQITQLKSEIDAKPSEIPPLQAKLEERLDIMDVNFKGLVKEIELLKYNAKYAEKKFESIFMLISNLKGSK